MEHIEREKEHNEATHNEQDDTFSSSTNSTKPIGSCSRFLWDLRVSPFFSLSEPNVQYIDVASSFAGCPVKKVDRIVAGRCSFLRQKWCIVLCRTVVLGWCISTLIYDIIDSEYLWIWMGYVTNWALVLSIASLMSSWVCTVWSSDLCEQPPLTSRGENNENIEVRVSSSEPSVTPKFFVKMTWSLFSVAAPLQIMVFILYWALMRLDDSYMSIMTHGVIALLNTADGIFVGRIPVRFKHFIFLLVVTIAYTIWSVIHSFLEMGNASYRGEDNDPIYGILNWKENPVSSAILVLITVFIGCPLVYTFVWMLSVLGCGCGRGRDCFVKLDGSRRPLYEYPMIKREADEVELPQVECAEENI